MNFSGLLHMAFVSGALLLSACGGGGDGASAHQPTMATLKLSTSGTLAPGTAMAGIGVSVVLPGGVTVKTDAGGTVSNDVITISGGAAPGAFTPPVYTRATGAAMGKLTFVMAGTASAGFGIGEFATVVCDIAVGANPTAGDFSLTDFKPVDLNGAAVGGLTANVAATIK